MIGGDDVIRDAQRGGAGRRGAAQHVAGDGADARDRSEHRGGLVVDGFLVEVDNAAGIRQIVRHEHDQPAPVDVDVPTTPIAVPISVTIGEPDISLRMPSAAWVIHSGPPKWRTVQENRRLRLHRQPVEPGGRVRTAAGEVNVDLPWNPSRLEQRKGRVQRIGQARDDIHVLSLRYVGTVEDDVYRALSERFGDIFSVLGQLPDGFEDEWINAVLRDRAAVRNFSQRVERARPPMELRYLRDIADDKGLDWEYTERVLSSRDLDEWMRQGW
jgi:hypothetical protein